MSAETKPDVDQPRSALPDTFSADPNPEVAVAHAVPHAVVSQVLHDDVAAFILPDAVAMRSTHDAQCCVSEVTINSREEATVTSSAPDPEAIAFAAALPHLTTLRGFHLKGSRRSCAPVAQLTQLRELEFGDCDTDTVGPEFFAALPNLTELHELRLWSCPGVDAQGVAEIVKLTWLEVLQINFSRIDAEAISHLPKLTHLRVLDIQRTGTLDDAALTFLPQLLELRVLAVSGSQKNTSAKGFMHVACIPQLEQLEVTGCRSDQINADVVRALSQRPALTALDVGFCYGFDDKCLALLTNLPDLRRLTVSYCDNVKRDGIRHIITRMPTLRYLSLLWNEYANADTFANIAAKLPLLEELKTRHCLGIDADTLQHISGLRNLQHLDVSGCVNVTTEAAKHALEKLPRLKTLQMRDCPSVDEGALADFRRRLK